MTLEVTAHNRIRFELPRLDKGQGSATAIAILIADELDADYDRTDVTLSDARSDRPYTITGSSSAMRAMWAPVRMLAAEARARLITAAAQRWGVNANTLTTRKSMVFSPDGRRANYGELSAEAANPLLIPAVSTTPKDVSAYTLVGVGRGRKNARDIVTGAQKYTLDLDIPGAVHAVVARPPDIKGTVASFDASAAQSMPGVVGVVQIPLPERGAGVTGIAVAARTFKEAFDARDALSINWAPGPLAGVSDADIRASLVSGALPLLPPLPLTSSLDASFDYPYIAHAPLEVMTAVANVQAGSAEVWYASQTPNYAVSQIASATGLAEANITLHVPFAGGSFGRHLFAEAGIEAALISQALGVPVKLLWTRNDDMRHGRFRPMAHHELRATWLGGLFLSYQHNVSAVELDATHGLGDAITAAGFAISPALVGQAAFNTTVSVLYDFGVATQLLAEQAFEVPTCSWRSIYSGYTMTSNEIFVDELARAHGQDEVAFRLQYLSSDPARMCLEQVVAAGSWGRAMPAGQAQGVAVHAEYRSAAAYLVEIDTTGAEPRLLRAFAAVYVRVPINPKGLEAQMQGALIDAWSAMFRAGNHLDEGTIREGSYADFLWARMNHAPPTCEVHVFPAGAGETEPGGAGELGFPPAAAACVNAYARATGTVPRQFPIGEFA
jgi:isoquinoline 1-oxidoreductase beta subunit